MDQTGKHQRIATIDYVKAIAIVAVVFNHAGLRPFDPNWAPLERIILYTWVGFHVPSFFAVAGFLYYDPSPIELPEIARRLTRILGPYLVASCVGLLLGFASFDNASDVLYLLATGNVLGIYYFIFLLSIFIAGTWLFSRLPAPLLAMLVVGLFVYAASMAYGYVGRPSYGFFWGIRDPFFNYFLGYFLIGWIVAQNFEKSQDWFESSANVMFAVCLLGIIAYVGAYAMAIVNHSSFGPRTALYTIPYTICVVGLIRLLTRSRTAPSAVIFLSEASLTIYLYHFIFQSTLLPYVYSWHAVIRVPALVLAGILGSTALVWIGRGALRQRSRTILGA